MSFAPTRRAVAAGAAAVAALATAPALAKVAAHAAKASAKGDPQLAATLKTIADKLLARAPEQATLLGLDHGGELSTRLSDVSPAGQAADHRTAQAALALLRRVPRARLTGRDIVSYDSVDFALSSRIAGDRFGYGQGSVPYWVTQQNGSYGQVPEFLDSYHRVENAGGAAAYVSRLEAFAAMLDQETANLQADAGKGVVPPSFVVANAVGQQEAFRKVPAAESKLVTSLANRAKKLGLKDYAPEATRIVTDKIYPALDRQTAALKALKTNEDAGVWKLPQGGEYYGWALHDQTTTNLSAAEIHQTGVTQNAEIEAAMDAILKSQGLTKGSVGERMSALTADPKFLFPDSDAGRAACIAYVQGRIDAIRPLLPRLSRLGLKANVTVKRVPADIQDGASLGYMNFASIDGKRPAIYYINLKSMSLWPKYQLPSLSAHEAIPGHAWQGAYLAEHASEVPPTAQLLGFNAFVEGWALYAEQLVDEQGLYKDDPFGRLGYLQAQKFRASRLIVDTGLHHLRWSRDKAIATLVANTGRSRGACQSEVDRYCASPAQACGYKVGHNEIVRLRARAMAALGPKFDIRDFNDALVMTGGAPLSALPGVVDRMVKAKQA